MFGYQLRYRQTFRRQGCRRSRALSVIFASAALTIFVLVLVLEIVLPMSRVDDRWCALSLIPSFVRSTSEGRPTLSHPASPKRFAAVNRMGEGENTELWFMVRMRNSVILKASQNRRTNRLRERGGGGRWLSTKAMLSPANEQIIA